MIIWLIFTNTFSLISSRACSSYCLFNHDDRHSTSGNLLIFGGGAICWASRKQSVVALSTAESEYIALSAAVQEAAWLQKLLADLRMPSQPIVMMEDNQGAIALAKNPVAHSRTKHIDIHFHYIREAQENGLSRLSTALPRRCWLTLQSLFPEILRNFFWPEKTCVRQILTATLSGSVVAS